MKEEEIKKIIAVGLSQGLNLNQIHQQLTEEHQVKMTFMDVRIMSADLDDANWAQFDPKKVEKPVVEDGASAVEEVAEGNGGLTTKIELNKVQRPGAMISGSVTFMSGVKGDWYVDQYGALGLSLHDETKQPTPEDMTDFQLTLQRQFSGR